MKLFRFYPETYIRMYFLAESEEAAELKKDELWAVYMKRYDWLDPVEDAESIAEYRKGFDFGFTELESAEAFVDTHY